MKACLEAAASGKPYSAAQHTPVIVKLLGGVKEGDADATVRRLREDVVRCSSVFRASS